MRFPPSVLVIAALAVPGVAQHAQVSSVAVDPTDPNLVWVANRDNDSVSVVNVALGSTETEVDVGIKPRSLAFSADGSTVFVANQRGNVPHDVHFVTPFTGTEIRGSVSVIDRATRTVSSTLTSVGVEPYGLAVAPNGKWFAVTAFRSNEIRFFDTATLNEVFSHAYEADMDFISPGKTIADVDSNQDGLADLGEPRGFVIKSDSQTVYVTHHRSPFISVLDLTLDGNGMPTALSESKINQDIYPFDIFFNPVPVQTLKSQGRPRFSEDIALSPDGTQALVPSLLHNINHDVNHSFPGLPGDFANRVYPTLTALDMVNESFAQPGDSSLRLHHELSEGFDFAEYIPVGDPTPTPVGLALVGGVGKAPVVGGKIRIWVEGIEPGKTGMVYFGRPDNIPMGSMGTVLVKPRVSRPIPPGGGLVKLNIPNSQLYNGVFARAQAVFFDANGQPEYYSNGVDFLISDEKYEANDMGRRAGHPSRVAYNAAGDRVLMLNRGSEDLFLYEVGATNPGDLTLRSVFPPRVDFVERTPLDTTTPMGDLPLGMAIADDPSTVGNNDSLVYVHNELTRTLSVLRVAWDANVIFKDQDQIPLLLNPDKFSVSVITGNELFEDASRGQTTGAPGTMGGFNNSCASCHFEGGEDGNVWQRPAGPRSTMPVYGGTLGTGLVLWKGVRLNMGETGPMFGGENGGHGLANDFEQQALIDYHETIAVPLNPNLDPVTGGLTAEAAFGADLFHARNDTGLNNQGSGGSIRHSRCAECHADEDDNGAARGFTVDFIDPQLSLIADNLGVVDPDCIALRQNFVEGVNLQAVNSGVNIDGNNDGEPDLDRNADGYRDIETYDPMNVDTNDGFFRDDPNGYMCPDPFFPGVFQFFDRAAKHFSVPTKLGVRTSGPYFHDHVAWSLRHVVDPDVQENDPIYGSPAYTAVGKPELPGGKKLFNEFHDIRGHEFFVPLASKVQLTLQSIDADADTEAILAYVRSL